MYNYAKYARVNSQLNEQQNSSTQNLDRQLSYMTEENFVNHCNFFLWKKNEEKRALLKKKEKKGVQNSDSPSLARKFFRCG